MGKLIGVVFALILLAAACGGGDDRGPTASPTNAATASPSPTASAASGSPSPGPIPTFDGTRLALVPDIEFPNDTAMIIESGCWGCDGGPGPLWRVYREPSGAIRQEKLVDRPGNGLPRKTYDSPTGPQESVPVSGHAIAPNAGVIALSLCVVGSCHFSGLYDFDPDSQGIAYRSLDGGVSWQELGRGGPVYGVAGVFQDGRVLIASGDQDDGQLDYRILPDNTPVTSPAQYASAVILDERIFWVTYDDRTILNADGSLFFEAPDGGRVSRSVLNSQVEDVALVSWEIPVPPSTPPEDNPDRWGIAQIEINGSSAEIVREWRTAESLWRLGWWSYKDDVALATIYPEDRSSPLPALIDLRSGTVSRIPHPFSGDVGFTPLGRTSIHAVQNGPFARVTGTGSCLNVRAEPSLSGQALTCMADGVLLQDMEDARDADGQTWVRVMTPGHMQGWASAGYLER